MDTFVQEWSQYLPVALLVMIRLSGIVAFAPIISSSAIAIRTKASLVICMAWLLAPAVAAVPSSCGTLNIMSIVSEVGVGLVFGLVLSLLAESLQFAGAMLGMEFSFSLVNLMDPNTRVETQVVGQTLNWLGILVLLASGLHLSMIAALIRSFAVVPVGSAVVLAGTSGALISMAGGIFLAGIQLAAPVMAATITLEIAVSLVSRISPQIPAMVVGVPTKMLLAYGVLIASLGVWPRWIEDHFVNLLKMGNEMIAPGRGLL